MGSFNHRRFTASKIRRRIGVVRRNLQRVRLFLSFILIICICYLGFKILKLPQWYIPTSKLETADKSVFIVQGNVITPQYKIYDIIRQTKLPYKQMFRLKTKELEENIYQLQSIKKVYIRRRWFPARVIISIEERNLAFLLVPNLETEPSSALTTDGILLDHDYFPLNSSIKAKKLLTYGIRNGVDEVWDKDKVETLLKIVKAIETYSSQEVKYIDIRNQKDVYIMIQEYLIRFGEINSTSLNRAKNIASILPEARKIQQKIKYIDLRWDDSYYLRLEGAQDSIKQINKIKNKSETKQDGILQNNMADGDENQPEIISNSQEELD